MLSSTFTSGLRQRHARLAALRRRTTAKILGSAFFRSQTATGRSESLAISPGHLGVTDPRVRVDLAADRVDFDGESIMLDGLGLFDVAMPSDRFARFAAGFAWLDTLRAQNTEQAIAAMQGWTADWLAGRHRLASDARDITVVIRRLKALLNHADTLLADADAETYDALILQIVDDLHDGAARWRSAPDGPERVIALITVLLGALAVAEDEEQIAKFEALLIAELGSEFGRNGGPQSRCATDTVDVLANLIPLVRTHHHLGREVPPQLLEIQAQMNGYLRTLRLGDMSLARFNGVGATETDTLFRILKLDAARAPHVADVVNGYVRLEGGPVVVIADVATAPPLPRSAKAHAGAFSFEMSDGSDAVFLNCGHAQPMAAGITSGSRTTSCHNALELGSSSSASFLEREVSDPAAEPFLAGPAGLKAQVVVTEEAQGFTGQHDGYARLFGLRHTRSVSVQGDGTLVSGRDTLKAPSGDMRFAADVPFAVRFHVAPDVDVRTTGNANEIRLLLPGGADWVFNAGDTVQAFVEETVHVGSGGRSVPGLQIALRGACHGEADVAWSLKRAP